MVVDFNKVAPEADMRVSNFEEFLVQLAWRNNPETYIHQSEIYIAKQEVELAKREWVESFDLSFNMNEISLSNVIYDYEAANIFVPYPIWNFRASVDLGTVFLRPIRKNIAQEKVKISEQRVNLSKLKIRAETLALYETYLKSIEVISSKTKAEEDAEQTYILIAEKFRNGDSSLEDFTLSSRSYFNAEESLIRAELDLTVSKINLEELIGISLEEADKMGAHLKKESILKRKKEQEDYKKKREEMERLKENGN